MNLLNVGCGTHYASGWVNTDVWADADTRPDVVVSTAEPFPFPEDCFDGIFLGHVLEHVPWGVVLSVLDGVRRVARPGAPILVVGPDTYRTLERWRTGDEPWEMVISVLEHQGIPEVHDWAEAAHHWNCHLDRVVALLERAGFQAVEDLTDVIPNDVAMTTWHDDCFDITWPVVGKWHWQFAVRALAPGASA